MSCLLLLASACSDSGGNDGGSGGGMSAPDVNSPLIGLWEGSGCEIGAGSSRDTLYAFGADGTVELTFRNYAATNCSNLTFTDTARARFTEGSQTVLADGRNITSLDFDRLAGRTITPVSEEATLSFNMSSACGLSDWQTNVPRTVQECRIGLFDPDAQLLDVFQIYHIADDYFLYFGNELIFSAAQRPTELSRIPGYVRQIPESEGFPAEILGFWQITGTNFYYELRANAILVEYLPSSVRNDCFDVTASATRSLGNDFYGAPGTQSISIVPSPTGITFITPSGDTFLNPAAPTLPTDLVPCASLPGG